MSQHTTDNWKGHWYWGYAELSYEFDSFNTLSIYASQNGVANYGEAYQTTNISDINAQISESIKTDINIDNKSPRLDFGLDFRKKYSDNEEHELTFSAFKQTQKDIGSYQSIQDYKLSTDHDIYNVNKSQIMEHTFMLDYREPISNNLTLETGTKLILRHSSSNYRMLERSGATEYYTENPDRTDNFFYNQNVGSLYATLAFPLKSYKIKFGIRGEQTWINASFNGDSLPLVSDKTGQMLKLNYSKRIQRPWLYYLNPYIDDQNPRSISYGNPFLKPEKTHSITFSWNYFFKQKSLDIALSNSNTDDVITSYTFLDTNDISRTSYLNIAKSNILGLNISFSTTLYNKLKVWVNARSSFVNLTHKLDNSRNRNGFNHSGNGSFTWSHKHGFSTTLGGWVYQSAPTLQTVRRLSYNYDFSVRKTFFKKKLTMVLVANNFLEKKQTLKTIGEDPTFYSESSWTNNLYRFYGFNLSYNFGTVNKAQKANEIDSKRRLMQDRDYDGVPDEYDVCPDEPGLTQFGGCSSALMTTIELKTVFDSLVYDVASIGKTLDSLNTKKTELPPVVDAVKIVEEDKSEYSNLVKQDLRSFYVIVISTRQFALAKESSDKWSKKFSKVSILPQSNGFYRVGISASNSKPEALKVLDFVKSSGAMSAWLSFE
jgi:hypothetical protein